MRKVDQIEKVVEYNLKIDARFIRYLSHDNPFSYEEVKNEGSAFHKVLNAFLVFKETQLHKASVNQLYQALTNKDLEISNELVEKIINAITINQMITCFIELIKSDVFPDKSEEMAKLIFNKMLISQKYCPIIFYPNISNQIIKEIKEDAEDNKLDALFCYAYLKTVNKLNRKQRIKTQDEVIQIMRAHKEMLKDLYGIISIGLFGSFARGNQHAYSDMDIWIKLERRINYTEKFLIKNLLETMLDVHVDLNIWTKSVADTVFHDSLTVF